MFEFMKDVRINFYLLFTFMLVIYLLFSGVTLAYNKSICEEKGFDKIDRDGLFGYKCMVKTGYNNTTGKDIYCYMPVKIDKQPYEWCNMETKNEN